MYKNLSIIVFMSCSLFSFSAIAGKEDCLLMAKCYKESIEDAGSRRSLSLNYYKQTINYHWHKMGLDERKKELQALLEEINKRESCVFLGALMSLTAWCIHIANVTAIIEGRRNLYGNTKGFAVWASIFSIVIPLLGKFFYGPSEWRVLHDEFKEKLYVYEQTQYIQNIPAPQNACTFAKDFDLNFVFKN